MSNTMLNRHWPWNKPSILKYSSSLFIELYRLPPDDNKACKMALQQSLFTVVGGTLYYIDPKHGNRKQAVVPRSLQRQLLEETHPGPHFSGERMFNILVSSWWWERLFSDASTFAKACPECAITTGVCRRLKPPLHPIYTCRETVSDNWDRSTPH